MNQLCQNVFSDSFVHRYERFGELKKEQHQEAPRDNSAFYMLLFTELGWTDLLWQILTSQDRSNYLACWNQRMVLTYRIADPGFDREAFEELARCMRHILVRRGLVHKDTLLDMGKKIDDENILVFSAEVRLVPDWRKQLWDS